MYTDKELQDIAKTLVAESFRVIKDKEVGDEDSFVKLLHSVFLATYLYDVLRRRPTHIKTKKGMEDYCLKLFLDTKMSIQDSVAAAFQAAMHKYTGKQVDYYCKVTAVAEPTSKLNN